MTKGYVKNKLIYPRAWKCFHRNGAFNIKLM